jgi:hypothetical protein
MTFEPPSTNSARSSRKLIVGLGIGLAVLAIWMMRWIAVSSAPMAPAERSTEARKAPDLDERFHQMLIGTWEDDYQGKRTMTLNEDGTGTMVVELSGWRAVLSAPRLRFDMVWSVEDGRLKKRTVGGEPEAQVQMILKTMGDRVEEEILELVEHRLLLLDQDGKTKYEWRRAAPATQ